MELQRLQHTDLSVSRICLGTMTFGGQCDEATARRMVDFSLDQGVNFIDTANAYNCGAAEEMVGRILQGRRNRVTLASKVGLKMGDEGDQSGLSRRAIFRAVDESLQRLRTDRLDIHYLHQPDYSTPYEETLAAMEDLVRSGKVRYPAVSNFASWQICLLQGMAEKAGYRSIHISQPMYNLLARGIEQEYFSMAKQLGVSTIAYNPLAGGLLTGKHKAESPLPGTRFDQSAVYRSRYWKKANFCAIERLGAVACANGRSMVSVGLSWILHHSRADCVVLGASRLDQLQENVEAIGDGPLSPEILAVVEEVGSELAAVGPQYNR